MYNDYSIFPNCVLNIPSLKETAGVPVAFGNQGFSDPGQFSLRPQRKYSQKMLRPLSYTKSKRNPYGLKAADSPNILYLIPAFFGSSAAFIVGFSFFGHSLTCGYSKVIFFINVYAIIVSIGAGVYVFELLSFRDGDSRFFGLILPLISVILFFALAFNLIYSVFPFTFSGTIGDTPLTQFLSFLSLSIGSISVGETFNISPEKTGTQVLASMESFWNLFILSLLISLLV